MKRVRIYQWIIILLVTSGRIYAMLTEEARLSFLGLPQWLWDFVLFHLVFLLALYHFIYHAQSNN